MGEVGIALAKRPAEVFGSRLGAYPDGIAIDELNSELRMAGNRIDGDNPSAVLRSALNASQANGIWEMVDGGLWALGNGASSRLEGLTGNALADALYEFVRRRWPNHLLRLQRLRTVDECAKCQKRDHQLRLWRRHRW